MARELVVVALLAAVTAGSACARAQARTEPEMPALDVPAPPPRIVSPLESEPLPVTAEVVADEEPERPNPRRSRPARSGQRAAETPKEDVETPAEPADARRPAAAAGDDAPRLRMVQPSEALPLERSIQQVLARAAADLNRVDYGALNTEARGQYDTAKRFIQQGEDALKVKNYVFAEILADKAAVLAGVLLAR